MKYDGDVVLPSLCAFSALAAQTAMEILDQQPQRIKDLLLTVPMLTSDGSLAQVGAVCDQMLFRDQMPSVQVPLHCRDLAAMLNVCLEASPEFVAQGLQLFGCACT